MAQSATKATFIGDLQSAFNALIPVKLQLADLTNTYFKNGFNSTGSNPIVDADVAGNGLTATKVAAAITLAQNLANLFGNVAVVTSDYEATLQQLRTS